MLSYPYHISPSPLPPASTNPPHTLPTSQVTWQVSAYVMSIFAAYTTLSPSPISPPLTPLSNTTSTYTSLQYHHHLHLSPIPPPIQITPPPPTTQLGWCLPTCCPYLRCCFSWPAVYCSPCSCSGRCWAARCPWWRRTSVKRWSFTPRPSCTSLPVSVA